MIGMPDEVSFLEGAAIEPAAVTLRGVKRADIQAGGNIAVLGCGTIGLFAVKFAKIMGAGFVAAVDIDPSKLIQAKTAGADFTIDSSREDPIQFLSELTEGRMADASIETAGTCVTQEQAIRAARKAGKVLYLGTSHKDVVLPPNTFERIVRGELTIKGSWNSFSAPFPGTEWRSVLRYLDDGRFKIRPFITHTIPLEKAPETIADMAAKEFAFTKVVIEIG